jgi:hypothetical protein
MQLPFPAHVPEECIENYGSHKTNPNRRRAWEISDSVRRQPPSVGGVRNPCSATAPKTYVFPDHPHFVNFLADALGNERLMPQHRAFDYN